MSSDWFRNTTWDASIEEAFNKKLRRARRKESYLRIQASTLSRSHPEVALRLLDRYFELDDDFDHAQAQVDRARSLFALGREDESLNAYEAALAREAVFPKVLTQAYLDLPYIVAIRGVREKYQRALDLLSEHQSRLMFPVDHFRWHTAHALIADALSDSEAARMHAVRALKAEAQNHSGFRFHPNAGLVTHEYEEVVKRLKALCSMTAD
jgi:tetratricopeptide (TPR) repeat protein